MNQIIKLNNNHLKFFLCVIFCVCFISIFSQPTEISVQAATTAYNQFNLKKSRDIYENILGSPISTDTEKIESLQNLAQQDWKVFRDYKSAMQRLHSALLMNDNKSKTFVLLGQINLEAGKYTIALDFADKAITGSKNETAKTDASLLKAQIIDDENIELVKHGKAPDTNKLLEASGLLKFILSKQPGNPAASELLSGVSLLLKDGPTLFSAWKSYYFITGETGINQVLLSSYNTFNRILPAWRKSNLSSSEKDGLIKALAKSGFYNYASLLATSKLFGNQNITDSSISQILHFEKYIETIGDINALFYPKIAAGLKNYENDYDTAITNAAKKLWVQLNSKNSFINYDEDLFFAAIKSKFGAEGYIGTTVGYFSMLLGLIVHDEMKEINQYGYKANFRYESISHLISVDFTTWYGATNVGGWGTDSSIIQVRDAYLKDPFTRLTWMTDTSAYNAIAKQIADAIPGDITKCRANMYAEPSFLAPYLKLNASKLIFDSLQKTGLNTDALYLAFISESIRLNVASTVFAHEGRHAIDQLFFKAQFDTLTQDDRELRAKFSEIIFSGNPKLALTGSIIGGDLDSTTNHGKANLRLRKIIVNWMQLHNKEIDKLDMSIPLLVQLDLLTPQQLIAICLSADPLALATNAK